MIEIKSIKDDKYLMFYLFEKASKDTHRNSKNYKNLSQRFDNYIDFHCVFHENRPVSFAGIYKNPTWPDNLVRVLDRAYYFNLSRPKGLFKPVTNVNSTLSQTLLPIQTKIVLEKGLIPFYSIENFKRRKSIELSLTNYNKNNYPKYIVLPGLYCTTDKPHLMEQSEWQTVATLEQYKNSIKLPYMNYDAARGIFNQ